jgi:hypothetical protein
VKGPQSACLSPHHHQLLLAVVAGAGVGAAVAAGARCPVGQIGRDAGGQGQLVGDDVALGRRLGGVGQRVV